MLSVAKLVPGQEAYYERSVAQGLDDYYDGRGESPGVWTGRGSGELDLMGVVGEGDLGRLISGVDPASGVRLREHAKARTITVERIDWTTGERGTERRELRPVAGFDLVSGAPKSVSLLHALGDHDTRLAVSQAHESAWQAALVYLEDEACVTRRGRGGIVREHAGGFVAAALEETGGVRWRAAQVAAIETRDRKEVIDLPLLREQWWERARAFGFGERELDAALFRAPYRRSEPPAGESPNPLQSDITTVCVRSGTRARVRPVRRRKLSCSLSLISRYSSQTAMGVRDRPPL